MILVDQYVISFAFTLVMCLSYYYGRRTIRLGIKEEFKYMHEETIAEAVEKTVDKLCDEGYLYFKHDDDGEIELIKIEDKVKG